MELTEVLQILQAVDALTTILHNRQVDTTKLALFITRARSESRSLDKAELDELLNDAAQAISEIPGNVGK